MVVFDEKKHCPLCKTQNLVKFISFGKMPVANAFLKPSELQKPGFVEYVYNMDVGFCENCNMVQLINIVPYAKYIVPDETGKTHYAFFSSTSVAMQEHFADLAHEVEQRFLDRNPKVLEIGSNDGIMLKSFLNRRNVLGIEPSQNVAEIAQQQGIETITQFFSEQLAKSIVLSRGRFRVVLSTNVTLNIIDLHDLMRGLNALLDDNGVFITEDPYILDILEKTSYDQIYDEHIWYFSLTSLSNLYRMHGFEIFDAERQWVHGGSMRVYACKRGTYPKTQRFLQLLEQEKQKGIDTINPYIQFAENTAQSKKELQNLLLHLKSQDKKIVGYAAASKGTIIQNYCNVGREILDYISDSTPYKQGLLSPGKHIPIVSPEHFHNDKNVDYALLAAWNHAAEIMKKETDFLARGGRFIVHYPKARILEPEFTGGDNVIKQYAQIEQSINSTTANSNTFINNLPSEVKNTFSDIRIKPLKLFSDEQGYLFETLRQDDELFDGKFGQVLVSVLYPGVIKGLHRHSKQTDYTTCIKGNIKYVVAKEKAGGSREADFKTFVVGETNPILIKIPPGYWHGYMVLGGEKAIILHTMDKTYNPQEPDTDEISPFTFGDVWTIKDS